MSSDHPVLPSTRHKPGAKRHVRAYDSFEDREMREQQNRALDTICKMEANVSGLKSGGAATVGCMLANYVLQRTSQTYRCRIELTGKLLAGSIIVYTAFYVSSFRAEKQCMNRNEMQTVRHGMLPRVIVAPDEGEVDTHIKTRLSDLEPARAGKL